MNLKKLFVCFGIAACIVGYQYAKDRQTHVRLATNGRVTTATSSFSKQWTGNYVHFKFVTANGQQIEHFEKCGKETFERDYKNMMVIYNVNDPNDFMNLSEFNSYSIAFRLVFFFGIYLPFLTLFLYIFERNIRMLYKFFRGGFPPKN